jgi:DNA repair protein RecO (recombination protein O)
MAIVTDEGVVLKTHALGDTSRIVTAYTREHGLRKFVAKGARKPPNRFGYSLEPLSRSRFVFYLKPDRDLHLLSKAEVLDALGSRLTDLKRLAHAQAALEIVDRLVWGEEPHPRLFALLVQALDGCARAPVATLPAVTLAFQLQLASEMGYRPRLDQCAIDGRPVSQRRAFSPSRGGLLCDACAAREGGIVFLSPEALGSFALLMTRPILEAGEFVELPRARELFRLTDQFFRTHFQRFKGLRSLEVLRGLGADERPAAPKPPLPYVAPETPAPEGAPPSAVAEGPAAPETASEPAPEPAPPASPPAPDASAPPQA